VVYSVLLYEMALNLIWNVVSGRGGILSTYLFSVDVDNLVKKLRQSRYGIYVGSHFVGCILYADDIVLLSGRCHGLQKWLT